MHDRDDPPIDLPGKGGETVYHDWIEDGSPSYAVITAVAEATGRRPEDLRPLNDVIDPDGLDVLFDRRPSTTPREDVRLSFRFGG